MTWRNLREELCEVLAETIEARVPLGSFHPNQSVHVETGGRTKFGARPERTTCRECKTIFAQFYKGKIAKFCSRACRLRVWKRKRIAGLTQEIRAFRASTTKCPCGKAARSTGRNTGSLATYCSRQCGQRQRAHRKRCIECVYRGARACKFPSRKPSASAFWRAGRLKLTGADLHSARMMRAEGELGTEIAARFGISERWALKITKGSAPYREVRKRKPWGSGPRGAAGGLKLTGAQVEEARQLRASGAILKVLAARFGISGAHASRICRSSDR